jgi:hypothetical protein
MMALLDSVSARVEPPDSTRFEAMLGKSSTMWRVSHIRVGNERLGRALRDSVAAGVSFSELARRHSTDSTSAKNGGDLGWAREDLYIPEFHTALSRVSKKGGVAGPVKTADGWHLLMLADTHTETVGQSEAMRSQLRDAAMRDLVMTKVRDYVGSLRKKYGVVVQDSLLSTLDYGSKDAAVQSRLHDGNGVLAKLPWHTIDVRELTRRIRFQYFHGIEGKADAAKLRDKVFDEWLTELLLRHEASAQGLDKRAEIVAAGADLERSLIRESVGKKILNVPFDAKPDEVARYWTDHPKEFTPLARVRADGVLLADEASARKFREQLDSGAKLRWLADRSPGVKDPKPALFDDWVAPAALGLSAADLTPGRIVGPLAVQGAWAVASIQKIESVRPTPLEKCRSDVLAAMRAARTRELMTRALARLESAAKIKVADGARETIAARISAWTGRPSAALRDADSSAGARPGGAR